MQCWLRQQECHCFKSISYQGFCVWSWAQGQPSPSPVGCGGWRIVGKQLLPRWGCAGVSTSRPALWSRCSITTALRSSHWRWKEQSRCVLHIRSMANGFAVFMDIVFLTKAKTAENVITLRCCCCKTKLSLARAKQTLRCSPLIGQRGNR